MAYSDQVTQAESGGNPNAVNPNSSAMGTGQFIAPTWLSTIKANRPDLAQGWSDEELLAMRADPALSQQMTDAYGNANAAILAKNGLPVTDGSKYLAHFAGPGSAVKVLQADPDSPVEGILSPQAIKANPFLKDMTAGQLKAWAAQKMGVQMPQPGVQSAPPAQAPQQPPQPQRALPSPAAPIFANAPQPDGAPGMPQPPPIFAPPRKPIDLSGLKAALAAAQSPIFANMKG